MRDLLGYIRTHTHRDMAGAARPVPFDQRRSNEKGVKLKRNQFTAGKVREVEGLCVSEVRLGSDPDKSSLLPVKRIFTFSYLVEKSQELETAITSAATAKKHSSALMTLCSHCGTWEKKMNSFCVAIFFSHARGKKWPLRGAVPLSDILTHTDGAER